ncbi:MAG: esterase [Gammaproteobacteria bacterium]|nr:esterase [Gammaproteobacteria bacterium]MDH5692342.1 esterase [Gammaproteobacteria bacterium]
MSAKQFISSLFLCVLLTACASNDIYRSAFTPCTVTQQQSCQQNSVQVHNASKESEYSLSFLEIDDQGQIRDRKQLRALLDNLYQIGARDQVLINVFVHGWHHNASYDDENVASFQQSLEKLSQIEHQLSKKQNRDRRKVIGVYVGWRGTSIDLPVIRYLTFWDRKNTAQEIGHLGVSELLLGLEEIVTVKNASNEKTKSRLVTIGHSFGGAVVYSATSQILASRFLDSQSGTNARGDAKGFGDLVVLLNPAFEALRFAPLYDLAQSRCSYFETQRPRLVILTSEFDLATRLAFPAGRWFSTFFESHQQIQREECKRSHLLHEGYADRNTVGHYDRLVTHELKPVTKKTDTKSQAVDSLIDHWRKQREGTSTQIGPTILTHLGKTHPQNPFLNIYVDSQLISGHNDVFGEDIMEFIRQLIVLSAGS